MSTQEIPLSRPDVTDLEIELVTRTLRSNRLSIGPMQETFEELVAAKTDNLYGVACSSGTAGLHMALLALNIGPGDEVITTPFSFIASANCILYVGAKPVFVDVCPRTLNMDPAKVEAAITPRTKAILAVETFGNTARMDELAAVANRHEIPLVEDCCEALGSTLNGRPAGSFGRVGVFGFYPNKQITTGEGGMIVTSDRRIAEMCRSLRNQGRAMPSEIEDAKKEAAAAPPPPGGVVSSIGSWLSHERLGYNYRMPEINAALGVGQMRRLSEIIERRQAVAKMYIDRLMTHPDLIVPATETGVVLSWFVFVVRLASVYTREERDRVIQGMRRHEIGAADYFPCIHLQPFYKKMFGYQTGDFPIAETVSCRTLALPFYSGLTARDVDLVCQTLELMISRENLKRT